MPIFSNGKHSGPPFLNSAEFLVFDAYFNPDKFDKKAIAAILGTQEGCGIFSHDKKNVDLARYYDSVKGSGPSFQALLQGSMDFFLCNPLGPLWRRVAFNLSTSHITPLSR